MSSTRPNAGPVIEFCDVSYCIAGGRPILAGLCLQVHRGELLVLLGRSGSGKSTALKLVNGLLAPTKGQVCIEGRPTRDWDQIQLRRSIGYAIQEVGLLPHLSVEKNIGLVPRLQKWPLERIRQRVDELMLLLQLPSDELRERHPHQLSGGQRQRVGLARALAADPAILLMDEPFGALDPLTRAEIQREFKLLQQRLGKTVVFVTHDVREAMLLGTRIALLDSGRLMGVYSAEEFLCTADPLAAEYVAVYRGDKLIDRPRIQTDKQ
ncbi:MAG: ATP-binding cassette domain-containing protein [Terriglobales bacterium]|jgi:osmoprotectant transport system ATP-binding protein